MRASIDKVRRDFDRIALATACDTGHSGPYDDFILQQIPIDCSRVLDVGCGAGAFSRTLAARGHRVTGVDLSPEMIRLATMRSDPKLDVTFRCADFMHEQHLEAGYDAVVSISMLHHVLADEAIPRMAGLVRPGGVLVVHDVTSDSGMWDWPRSAVAIVARAIGRLRMGRIRDRAAVRSAWRDHGRGERYLTIEDARNLARRLLPSARVHRHLQWRYTVVWRRPGT
jgi:2-polyprenyl-3-methyl-5-hydroxy-6-metoxy-1,4-benzoquinol methylase